MKPLSDLFKQAMAFDDRAAFENSMADDLSRFNGKFPTATIELIAVIVACSKMEGAKLENARTAHLVSLTAAVLAAADVLIDGGFAEDLGERLDDALANLRRAIEKGRDDEGRNYVGL